MRDDDGNSAYGLTGAPVQQLPVVRNADQPAKRTS